MPAYVYECPECKNKGDVYFPAFTSSSDIKVFCDKCFKRVPMKRIPASYSFFFKETGHR